MDQAIPEYCKGKEIALKYVGGARLPGDSLGVGKRAECCWAPLHDWECGCYLPVTQDEENTCQCNPSRDTGPTVTLSLCSLKSIEPSFLLSSPTVKRKRLYQKRLALKRFENISGFKMMASGLKQKQKDMLAEWAAGPIQTHFSVS